MKNSDFYNHGYGLFQKYLTSKSLLMFTVISCVILIIVYSNGFYTKTRFSKKLHIFRKMNFADDHISLELQELAYLMQENLQSFEENHDCHSPGLKCGNYYTCGFACQIHQRMICLMIAYALNRTLLHNYIYKWPYSKQWPATFQHMTTRCKTRPNTLIVSLKTNPPEITEYESGKQIPYPLENGIIVPSALHKRLEKVHKFPFLWWVGQFASYTLKLVPEEEEMVNGTKEEIGFQSPIVGVHVRRTDKIHEKQNFSVFHELEEYIDVAESYYTSLQHPQPWRIFLASEDTTVFDEMKSIEEVMVRFCKISSKNRYSLPKWIIIGIPPNMTTVNWRERNEYLDEIVRDVTLLSQCDFVVCGFSSNVCRLVYEMMQSRNVDSTEKVYSLDFKYSYLYSNRKLNRNLVNAL